MSKTGAALIAAIEEAKIKGLVTLQASPDITTLRKGLKLSQKGFAETYRINPETQAATEYYHAQQASERDSAVTRE